jgi:hypothetical protein
VSFFFSFLFFPAGARPRPVCEFAEQLLGSYLLRFPRHRTAAVVALASKDLLCQASAKRSLAVLVSWPPRDAIFESRGLKGCPLEKLTELFTATGLIILHDYGVSTFHRLKCAQS